MVAFAGDGEVIATKFFVSYDDLAILVLNWAVELLGYNEDQIELFLDLWSQ